MNERSVRVFFRKVREQEPRLDASVVRLANAEAAACRSPNSAAGPDLLMRLTDPTKPHVTFTDAD